MIHTDNDHRAIAFVDPKLFEVEAELFDSKWWDYRFMHPITATLKFAEDYKNAVRSYLKKQIDLYIGTNARVLKKEDFFLESKATITGMWKARQAADKHGIPYDFWCMSAMYYADESCWPYYPKPSHLYSDKEKEAGGPMKGISMVEYIVTRWKEWSQVNVIVATDDFYLSHHNQSDPIHISHQMELIRQIKRSSQPEHILAIHLYERSTLSIEHAREHFSDKVIKKSKMLAG